MMSASISALARRGILITRPKHQAEHLAQLVEARGGTALRFPAIEIVALPDAALPRGLATVLASLDIAVFVSANAATQSWPVIARYGGLAPRTLVAAVGGGTARALIELGVGTVVHPTESADSEALLKLDPLIDVAGKHVAIFSGEGGRGLLRQTLTQRGAHVQTIACYRRAQPDIDTVALTRAIDRGDVAAITVTSAEGLRNVYALLDAEASAQAKRLPHFVPHARIAEAALALGVGRVIVTQSGDEALMEAMENYFAQSDGRDSQGVRA